MEDISFIDRLFNDQNIAGAWVVVGAIVTFLGAFIAALLGLAGILISNTLENKRKKRQRDHEIIKETYFDALHYLSFSYHQILKISSGENLSVDENSVSATYNFYKILLVASPEVIDKFTSTAGTLGSCLYHLIEKLVLFKKYDSEEQIAQDGIEFSINCMNEANADIKKYFDKGIDRPDVLEGYQAMFDNAQSNYYRNSEIKEEKTKEKYDAQITLVREGVKKAVEVSPAVYDCIFTMRKDLERQLTEEEMKKINKSTDAMIEKLELDTEEFIVKINKHVEADS